MSPQNYTTKKTYFGVKPAGTVDGETLPPHAESLFARGVSLQKHAHSNATYHPVVNTEYY